MLSKIFVRLPVLVRQCNVNSHRRESTPKKVNMWAEMTKRKLKTWKDPRRVKKHKGNNRILELKDDWSLFGR